MLWDIVIHSMKADEKFKNEKRKTDEARKYLHQKRHQEQAKFSDEETESSKPEATSTPVSQRLLTTIKSDVPVICYIQS